MRKDIKILLIFSVTIFLASSLTKQTNLSPKLPKIQTLYFNENPKLQLFFIAKNHKSFGYVSKQSGQLTGKQNLDGDERIIKYSKQYVLLSQGWRNRLYSVPGKESLTIKSIDYMKGVDNKGAVIKHYHGNYFAYENILILDNGKSIDELNTTQQIDLNLQASQKIQQLLAYQSNKLLVFTVAPTFYCLYEVDFNQMKNKKCFDRIGEILPTIKLTGNYIVIINENSTTIYDISFNIVKLVNKKYEQIYDGYISFSNFQSFNPSSKQLQNFLVVQQEHQIPPYFFIYKKQNSYILKQGQATFLQIPNITSEPIGAWINNKNGHILMGNLIGKYELVLQLTEGKLNLYEIIGEHSKTAKIQLKWSK